MIARFKQMVKAAKRSGKKIPSFSLLENLADAIRADEMKCPVCRRVMNWMLKEGRSTVVTLQHDRSGEMRLICKSCNSKHQFYPGDTFYDLPADHKQCRKCNKIKPNSEFYFMKKLGYLSGCIECQRSSARNNYQINKERIREYSKAYKKANRAKYNEYERNRARRLAAERRSSDASV